MARKLRALNQRYEDTLFFAFRYALGRKTGAVWVISDEIIRQWKRIRPHTQEQIKHEIEEAIQREEVGTYDTLLWKRILIL